MKRWMKYVKPYAKSFILGPLGMIVEVIGEMFMPLILAKIINDADAGNLTVDDVTAERFSTYLDTKDIPDPDLLIRTGGEMRISNYLLWQIAYSEFIVVKEFWPDFGKQNLADCILEFNNSNRRYGV